MAQNKQQTTADPLLPGAALLFKAVKTRLTVPEKNYIFQQLNFRISADKQSFNDGANEEANFEARALPADMNKDGIEEIFVSFGNTYTSGMTGSSIVLYIKKTGKKYEANLGFPSTLPDVLPTGNGGYPDLVMGGPGFEFPVWRWNGKQYDLLKTIKEKELLRLKPVSIEEVSQAYQKTIK